MKFDSAGLLTIMSLPSLFLAVLPLLSPLFRTVILLNRDAETRGFLRQRPILPAVFSWNNNGPRHWAPMQSKRAGSG